jgi:hypothetical protein
MNDELERIKMKCSWPNSGTILAFAEQIDESHTKTSFKIASV